MRIATTVLLLAAATALAQVEPVGIVGAERAVARQQGPPPAAERGMPVAPLVAIAIALAATGAAGWWGWRRWSRLDDTERAFLLLSLRCGVRHKERQRLRARADARGASPIAALLSDPD